MGAESEDLPSLSIILVCMNNLAYVRKTFDSLSSLNYRSAHIVIIDSSKSAEIYDFVTNSDCHLKTDYEWQSPQGVYAAMNLGIMKSLDNSYIWFLNPGDILVSPDTVQKLLATLSKTRNLWGFAQARNASPNQKQIYPRNIRQINPEVISKGELAISHQAIFVKKSELIKKGLFNTKYKIASDLEMILKLSNHSASFIEEVLVEIDQNGLSSRYPIVTIWESAKINYDLGVWSINYALVKLLNNLFVLFYGSLIKNLSILAKRVVK